MQNTPDTHKRAVNRTLVFYREPYFIPLDRQISADRLPIGTKIIMDRIAFKNKVEVLEITRYGKEKTRTGPSLESQRHHRPRTLQGLQNASLQIFAHDIAPLNGIGRADQLE